MRSALALSLVCLWAGGVHAELSVEQVLASSAAHFPQIQAAVEEKLIREGSVTRALGAFDLALKGDSLVWADGHYDGAAVSQRVVKPLAWLNGEMFAGYRIGSDDFPIYEQELVTNGGGEFNFGLAFSLWRDRAIDDRRFALAAARLDLAAAEFELQLARLATQRSAARAYWSWLASGLRFSVYRELTTLAENRMVAFERRARAGDIAAMYVTENRQYLLRRRALLNEARRAFDAAAVALSLYFRDGDGDMQRPGANALPAEFPSPSQQEVMAEALVDKVLNRRPELARLDNRHTVERERLRLARNALAPRVDVALKGAHDVGSGSPARDGFDAIVALQVEIPLERRSGKGRIAESQARLRQIEFERALSAQQLTNELHRLSINLNAAREFAAIAAEEAVQAELMEDAERQRFAAGASDFFLVNLREERRADARIRAIDAQLRYFHHLADLQAITLDEAPLGL